MNIIDQDSLEKEYRELVFVDIYWSDFTTEGRNTLASIHKRMDDLRALINDPVQQTIDVKCDVVEVNSAEP